MSEITFNFDELPLIIEGGFHAATISGSAVIAYEPDGEWFVREITLDGSRLRPEQERDDIARAGQTLKLGLFERKPIPLCQKSNPWLYATIVDRLEHYYADAIADEIEQALDDGDEHRAQLGKERAHRSAG